MNEEFYDETDAFTEALMKFIDEKIKDEEVHSEVVLFSIMESAIRFAVQAFGGQENGMAAFMRIMPAMVPIAGDAEQECFKVRFH